MNQQRISMYHLFLICLLIYTPIFAQSSMPGFVADYFPGSQKGQYGILVLGGSEGGKPTKLAKLFADKGHAVLSLAYFNEESLPEELEMVPLEYFEKPKKWLMEQEGVNASGIIVVGWSKGAELALLLASRDDAIKSVVAISPSSVIWGGILKDWKKTPKSSWSSGGSALPHVPFDTSGKATNLIELYEYSLTNTEAVRAASIPFEKTKADILLLSGSKDEVWPAKQMSETVMEHLEPNVKKRSKHVNYPNLGHLLDGKFFEEKHSSQKEIFSFLEKTGI